MPKINSYNIILDSKNRATCIIKVKKIYIEKFKKISKEHAFKEGEGDKSLSYWKKCHKKFFSEYMNILSKNFDENMKIVCEEFEVIFKI